MTKSLHMAVVQSSQNLYHDFCELQGLKLYFVRHHERQVLLKSSFTQGHANVCVLFFLGVRRSLEPEVVDPNDMFVWRFRPTDCLDRGKLCDCVFILLDHFDSEFLEING